MAFMQATFSWSATSFWRKWSRLHSHMTPIQEIFQMWNLMWRREQNTSVWNIFHVYVIKNAKQAAQVTRTHKKWCTWLKCLPLWWTFFSDSCGWSFQQCWRAANTNNTVSHSVPSGKQHFLWPLTQINISSLCCLYLIYVSSHVECVCSTQNPKLWKLDGGCCWMFLNWVLSSLSESKTSFFLCCRWTANTSH